MVNMDIKYNGFVQTELPSRRKTEQAKYFSDGVNKSLQTKEIKFHECLNPFGYMVWTVFI